MPLATHITDVCRVYFGTHKVVSGKKQLVGNRCGECPLRSPCLAWGGKPARTMGEIRRNNAAFAAEAMKIMGTKKGPSDG